MKFFVWFCFLAVGIALMLTGALTLNPHKAIYSGAYSSVDTDLTQIKEALQSPAIEVISSSNCNYGGTELFKFRVLLSNDECPFPFGTRQASIPAAMVIPIAAGGAIIFCCFVVAITNAVLW